LRKIVIILFSFFQLFVSAQTKQKDDSYIILNRIYNEPDDGPCNLFLYDVHTEIASKKVKCSSDLIQEFKKLKESSFKWKKSSESCRQGWIGMMRIENQLILKSNTYLDTIYFNLNDYHQLLIDYNGDSYIDSKGKIYKTLSKNKELKDFFDTPIIKYYYEMILDSGYLVIDSINVNEIKIDNQIVYNQNVKKLDSIAKFESITYTEEERRFSEEIEVTKNYECFNVNNNSINKFYFNQNDLIDKIEIKEIVDEDERFINRDFFYVLDIKIGDSEQKLKEKFPFSCKYINYSREYFRNAKGIYLVEVKFIDKKGYVIFYLKEGLITSIEVDFYYR
jgi:hypothetical protein